jgi:hypothetical protein
MKPKLLLLVVGMVCNFAVLALSADEVNMQNGDRYFGKVMAVTADVVVLDGEVLGKITVPRQKVASLTFATNAPAAASPTNGIRLIGPPQLPPVTETNAALAALLRAPATNLNSVAQIREQMLSGSPAALGKFNEIVGGMMSGKMDMAGLRREAKASADQLRALKRDLGPEAGESLDYYLEVLDNFLKEEPTPNVPQPKAPAP